MWRGARVVFERFTAGSRQALELAREEARLMNHSFIGTEHLLLGILREGEGVAARVLEEMRVSLGAARDVVEKMGAGSGFAPTTSPPFTPRAKEVLELSLREALQLGQRDIGTEHLLLGLVREGEGVAVQVLAALDADPNLVRQRVLQSVPGMLTEPERRAKGWSGGAGMLRRLRGGT